MPARRYAIGCHVTCVTWTKASQVAHHSTSIMAGAVPSEHWRRLSINCNNKGLITWSAGGRPYPRLLEYNLVCLAMERNQPDIFWKLPQEEILFLNCEASTNAILYRNMDALISLKANLHNTDDDGNTLLHFTARHNYSKAANLLLNVGASKTSRNICIGKTRSFNSYF